MSIYIICIYTYIYIYIYMYIYIYIFNLDPVYVLCVFCTYPCNLVSGLVFRFRQDCFLGILLHLSFFFFFSSDWCQICLVSVK